MKQAKPKTRLYVPEHFGAGSQLTLNDAQSHYLANVMRREAGDMVALFNGQDGEWLAEIALVSKKSVTLTLKNRTHKHISSPDVWLAFAPIKNKTELVVEKATELGVSKIIPVFMKHNVVTKVNMEKLSAHAVEAAEQCERHDIPEILEKKNVAALLADWPKDRMLLFADESGSGEALGKLAPGKYAVIIGPEGGFSAEEQQLLKTASFVKPFSLGPRILRADTAAVAALACVMAQVGDWENKPNFVSKNICKT